VVSQQDVRIVPRVQGKKGTWIEQPAVPWPDALVLPADTAERRSFGQSVESGWRIVGPVPAVIPKPEDLVLVDGLEPTTLRLHVEGRVQVRTTLAGQPHHCEGLLKLWEG